MDKQDVIRLAKEARPFAHHSMWEDKALLSFLEKFAALVAAETGREINRKATINLAITKQIEPAIKKQNKQHEIVHSFDDLPDSMFVGAEVARAMFGLQRATFKRRVRDGLLPKPHKNGRLNRWTIGELRQALAAAAEKVRL